MKRSWCSLLVAPTRKAGPRSCQASFEHSVGDLRGPVGSARPGPLSHGPPGPSLSGAGLPRGWSTPFPSTRRTWKGHKESRSHGTAHRPPTGTSWSREGGDAMLRPVFYSPTPNPQGKARLLQEAPQASPCHEWPSEVPAWGLRWGSFSCSRCTASTRKGPSRKARKPGT